MHTPACFPFGMCVMLIHPEQRNMKLRQSFSDIDSDSQV